MSLFILNGRVEFLPGRLSLPFRKGGPGRIFLSPKVKDEVPEPDKVHELRQMADDYPHIERFDVQINYDSACSS